ncbi:MAG: sigma-70 family RNA polymerase sigma factor [Lachnospiraceae bacterium]|nr:sigma-70 family RNA polymerase sigma factor [Lachnospiraceae bacterium]
MVITEEFKEQIYKDYSGKVFSYIRSKISNNEDAEDLMANVFVKVYQNLDKYDDSKASISTWIFNITRNTVIDFFRVNHVSNEFTEEMNETVADERDEFANILKEETLTELAEALKKLPERERDLLILHYYEGLTLKVVAEKLDMSYSNCKLVHNKALVELKSYLAI